MPNLHQLLTAMIEKGASDLHITTGTPPQLRIDGSLVPLKMEPLTPVHTKQLCYSILTEEQKVKFEKHNEIDLSFGVKNLARFRCNIFVQRGAVAGAFRAIPFKILSASELGLPKIVEEFSVRPRGLIIVTGPTGSGKSTIAQVLLVKFLEMGGRPVTLLDGDVVRKNLSSELGFSREHRDLNIHRIGFVASEITKNGGIAICAPIAPYDHVRKDNRTLIELGGGYILVHVSTPLEVCEARDRKGLYAKAKAGIIKDFTGVSDPYEPPDDADVVIDTTAVTPEEAAQQVYLFLEKEGYIGPASE